MKPTREYRIAEKFNGKELEFKVEQWYECERSDDILQRNRWIFCSKFRTLSEAVEYIKLKKQPIRYYNEEGVRIDG